MTINWQDFHKWRKSVYKFTEENKLLLKHSGLFRKERLVWQANGQNWQRRLRVKYAPPQFTTIASGNLASGKPAVIDISTIPTYRKLVLYNGGSK